MLQIEIQPLWAIIKVSKKLVSMIVSNSTP
jgi:hypothetical protein